MSVRTGKIAPAMAFLLGFAGFAFADESRLLTLDESIRIALQNSPAYQSSGEELRAAEAKQKEARAGFFPKFSLESSYTRLNEPLHMDVGPEFTGTPLEIEIGSQHIYDARVTGQQPIFTGFRVTRGYQMAHLGAKAARAGKEGSRQDLVLNVKTAYYGVLMAQEMLKVAESAVKRIEAHLSDLNNMYNVGLVARNDVLKAEVQQSNVALMEIQAENAVRMAKIVFLNVIGLPLDEEIRLEEMLAYTPKDVDLDEAVQTAFRMRPELERARYGLDVSDHAVRLAEAGRYPSLAGIWSYEYKSDQSDSPFKRPEPGKSWEDNWERSWVVGAVLSFNLWDWGQTHYQIARAKADYARTQHGVRQFKNGVRLEVTQHFLVLEEAAEKIAVGEKTVEQAKENLRVAQEKYAADMVTNTDLLDAQAVLTNARMGYVQALADHHIVEARLERSMGTLCE